MLQKKPRHYDSRASIANDFGHTARYFRYFADIHCRQPGVDIFRSPTSHDDFEEALLGALRPIAKVLIGLRS